MKIETSPLETGEVEFKIYAGDNFKSYVLCVGSTLTLKFEAGIQASCGNEILADVGFKNAEN